MKISEKLATVNDRFEVTEYDNGFLVEVGGQDSDEDWKIARIMVHESAAVIELFEEYVSLPKSN